MQAFQKINNGLQLASNAAYSFVNTVTTTYQNTSLENIQNYLPVTFSKNSAAYKKITQISNLFPQEIRNFFHRSIQESYTNTKNFFVSYRDCLRTQRPISTVASTSLTLVLFYYTEILYISFLSLSYPLLKNSLLSTINYHNNSIKNNINKTQPKLLLTQLSKALSVISFIYLLTIIISLKTLLNAVCILSIHALCAPIITSIVELIFIAQQINENCMTNEL